MIKPEWKEINGEKYFKFNKDYDRIRYFYGNLLTLIFIILVVVLGILTFWYVSNNLELLKSTPCELCKQAGYFCFKQ